MNDLRYALRMLLKAPAFSFIAIATLALGIGANTALFSVVNAVLLRPLPYPEPGQLFRFSETRPANAELGISYPNYLDWRAAQHTFATLAVYRRDDFNLTGTGETETLRGVFVTASYFDVMDLAPKLGRAFSERDDRTGGNNVVLLSESLWQRRFGSDPHIIGRVVALNWISYEVIGVMPASLSNPSNVDVYAPFGYYASRPYLTQRSSHPDLYGIARLKDGVSIEQAKADFDLICKNLEGLYPDTNAGGGVRFTQLLESAVGEYRENLWLLLGAVGFVLLIACANLANLLLARATGRRKELAVRAALGASRRRIMAQLLAESVLLSAMGGAVGLLLAIWGADAIVALSPKDIPRFQQVRFDGVVLAFSAIVSLGTGLLFGFLPAWKASGENLNSALQETGRGGTAGPGRRRSQALLIVGQVALACVLLTGAGLLVKSLAALQHVRLGFDPNHLLTMKIKLPGLKYRGNPNGPAEMAGFYRRLLERVDALPGVTSAAVSDNAPFGGSGWQQPFAITGQPDPKPGDEPSAEGQSVSEDYFKTMGTALLRGRAFGPSDSLDKPNVVIIDETFARRFFPGEDALGRQLNDITRDRPRSQYTIVGVVSTVRHNDLAEAEPKLPQCYYPIAQTPGVNATLLVRVAGDLVLMARVVRKTVLGGDADGQSVYDVRTMDDRLSQSLDTRRLSTILLGLFSGLALVLAALGVYGTLAYAVAQRTREIGIRMALGAQRGDVLGMVLRQSLSVVLIGIALGLVAAFAATRLLASLLYGVGSNDLFTYASVVFLLGSAALLASYIPARRAMKVDPMIALRAE
jgi:putative ABC transport system permease protein